MVLQKVWNDMFGIITATPLNMSLTNCSKNIGYMKFQPILLDILEQSQFIFKCQLSPLSGVMLGLCHGFTAMDVHAAFTLT